jgi:hypothetical protein
MKSPEHPFGHTIRRRPNDGQSYASRLEQLITLRNGADPAIGEPASRMKRIQSLIVIPALFPQGIPAALLTRQTGWGCARVC